MVGALFAVSTLAACSPASEPGAVTADEAHQLNDAAAMLDANSVDLNAIADAPETPSNQSDQTR
jgi:acetyl-CoA acetyltransferase